MEILFDNGQRKSSKFVDRRSLEKYSSVRFVADALKTLLNWELVGPFEVLDGALKTCENTPNMHLHYRYFYDTPEFHTVIRTVDPSSQFHLGYYRFVDDFRLVFSSRRFPVAEIRPTNCRRSSPRTTRKRINGSKSAATISSPPCSKNLPERSMTEKFDSF